MIISERIFKIIKEKNITQAEFGKRAVIPTSTISEWKKRRHLIGGKKAKKIVGVTADVTAEVVGGVLRLGARALLTVLLVFLTSGLLFACIFAYRNK